MSTVTTNGSGVPVPAASSTQDELADFLMFRSYLTPWLIRIGWWLLLAGAGFTALTSLFAGQTGTALILLVAVLVWRVLAELSMVLFGILEELRRR